jgi:hypothetical protein
MFEDIARLAERGCLDMIFFGDGWFPSCSDADVSASNMKAAHSQRRWRSDGVRLIGLKRRRALGSTHTGRPAGVICLPVEVLGQTWAMGITPAPDGRTQGLGSLRSVSGSRHHLPLCGSAVYPRPAVALGQTSENNERIFNRVSV